MKAFVMMSVVAGVLASLATYDRLPSEMAVHWNAAGEVDGTMAKPWAPFLLPLVMAGSALLLSLLPRVSPRGFATDANGRGFRAIALSSSLFLLVLHLGTLAFALGYPVQIPILIPILAGVLFVILGNYLSKVQRNFFIGIRTPWTLADDDVWYRTHRLAARMFIVAGLFIVLAVPLAGQRSAPIVLITAVVVAAVVPALYSFVIYREKGVSE